MLILQIASDFSNTKVHSNLFRELDSLGINQVVFNPIRTIRRDTIGKNEFQAQHTRFVYSDVVKPYHHYLYHVKQHCLFRALRNRVDVTDINLTHAATLMTDGGVAYRLYKKYHIPYVVSVRNTDINVFLDKMPHTWCDAKKILLNAQKIFFISQGLKTKFESLKVVKPILHQIENKIILMPNGIDDYYISNIRQDHRKGHGVIYIGDFSNNKNVLRLGKAILLLREEKGFEDVTLTIVGGGNNEDQSVEHMIDSNPSVFKYLGKVYDKAKLCEILGENRIFAMPSINETFGLVYIEALSQNLPVLYTKGQGIDGLFDDTIGIGVNPLSVQEIKEALQSLLHNSGNYSNSSIDFNAFRWSTIAEKYSDYYRDLLGCATINESLLSVIKRLMRGCVGLKYKFRHNQVGSNSLIGRNTHLRGCMIGKHVYIGSHCVINHARIGNYTCIASTAAIGGMEHSYWYPSISPVLSNKCIFGNETKIGSDVWIGAHVCVRQGVTIGDGAVIGAGSVVTHDIPAYTIAYGIPAKVMKKRFNCDVKEQLVKESRFWEMNPNEARTVLVRIENNKCSNIRNDDNGNYPDVQ